MSNMGLVIKGARLIKLLNQTELAKEMRVAQPTIARWETGATVPALHHRWELAKKLDIDFKLLDLNQTKTGRNYDK